MWKTLASGIAIAQVVSEALFLISRLAQVDSGDWALAALQIFAVGIVGVATVVAATILMPLPGVLPDKASYREMLEAASAQSATDNSAWARTTFFSRTSHRPSWNSGWTN